MGELDARRWQQIGRLRERRQRLAAARALQAAAEWRTREDQVHQQQAEVQQQAHARQRHGAQLREAARSAHAAADWRDAQAWSGELQRRMADGQHLVLLAHAEAMQARQVARFAQLGARRAAQDRDRAQQALARARERAEVAAQRAEDQQLEDLAPLRWWRGQGG